MKLVSGMNKKSLEKTFYLIAKYWLGELQCFVKISDNKEEITKLFKDKYMSTPEHNFGVTEESYQLLEVNAKELDNKTKLNSIDSLKVGDIIKFKELRTHLTNTSGTKYYESYICDIHDNEELNNIKKEIKEKHIELLKIMSREQFESMADDL